MAGLTSARLRILSYMADHGVAVSRSGRSTAWTVDKYQWPVQSVTIDCLARDGLIARQPWANETDYFLLTAAGLAALKDHPNE